MGKKQNKKSRAEKKSKKEQRKNMALGLTYVSSSNKMKNQNVTVPQLRKKQEKIIADLSQKKQNLARAELIKKLSDKLNESNPMHFSNEYQLAEESTVNAIKYDKADDKYLQENIEKQNEKQLNESNRDNSHKQYMRILNDVIENSDVILEVLDARDPQSCRSVEMENVVKGKGKKIILVLNKIDLVPISNAIAWQNYFRRELSTVLFKANTQNQGGNLSQSSLFDKNLHERKDYVEKVLQGNKAVGGEELMNLLKNYSREDKVKTKITVGVIGYPNVGKSSLINSVKRGKVVGVSSTPGFTRGSQEIVLDGDIKLMDCPGVVFSKSEDNILQNVIRTEEIKDPIEVVRKILQKVTTEYIIELYQLDVSAMKGTEITGERLLYLIGEKMKKYKKGGLIDLDKAARLVINDWNEGKLKYFTLPPNDDMSLNVQYKESDNMMMD